MSPAITVIAGVYPTTESQFRKLMNPSRFSSKSGPTSFFGPLFVGLRRGGRVRGQREEFDSP
jgi:hypothetical protein